MKNNGDFTPALIVKLILVLVFLLTAAFVSGVVIGKNGRRNIDRTSSDEEGINEKLSACIFNSDELRGKYLKLGEAAREKGLVDENDVVNTKVICKSVETSPVETFHETSPEEQPEPATEQQEEKTVEPEKTDDSKPVETSPAETKPVQTFHETSLQKDPEPVEKPEKTVEKPKTAETKTIDEILTEKKAEQKPVEAFHETSQQKCRFSIQLASLDTPEQVAASKKQFKSLKPRVISGESKGKKWYKVRSGCFGSREDAEAELPKVRSLKKDAFIVSE